jgi:hypothetical protein
MFGRARPIVHLYAVCWNEAHILPFFFRNYEPWVQRFVIFDNGSTDGTQALLSAKPNVELRRFPWFHPDSFVRSQRKLQNTCSRESRGVADWVVVTAIDEHLHHPDIHDFLRRCARCSLVTRSSARHAEPRSQQASPVQSRRGEAPHRNRRSWR